MAHDKSYILNQVSHVWLAVVIPTCAKSCELIQTANWKDSAFEKDTNKQIKAGEVADASQTAVAFRARIKETSYRKLSLILRQRPDPQAKLLLKLPIGLINWK